MKLYAYCLAPCLDIPGLESTQGITGMLPVLASFDRIMAVVTELENPYVPANKENIFAHDRVVSAVMRTTTPLPFRFGMIVSPEKLKSYVESNGERLRFQLDHVAGCVQMNVKILVRQDLEIPRSLSDGSDPAHDPGGPGTRFLARKRVEHGAEAENARKAQEVVEWLSAGLSATTKDSRVSIQASGSPLVVGRFLVSRKRLGEFSAAVDRIRRSRGDVSFMKSGPWAPYHFAHLGS